MSDKDLLVHRPELMRQWWWLIPFTSLFVLLWFPVWPAIWSWQLLPLFLFGLAAGCFAAFRVVSFRAYLVFGLGPLAVALYLIGPMGAVGAAAALALGTSRVAAAVAALLVAIAMLLAIAMGARRARSLEWGADQYWLKDHVQLKRYRAFDYLRGAKQGDNRSVLVWVALGIAAVNVIGLVLVGSADAFRIMLLPTVATVLSGVMLVSGFTRLGSLVAAFFALRELEIISGHRFILGNIEELHRERRKHWLGRWIAPKELRLDPIHGKRG